MSSGGDLMVKLFFTESCPYCVEPINYIKANNLEVELVDATHDKEAKLEIIKTGGKIQVPMLSINGQAMYESQEILKWLKENY